MSKCATCGGWPGSSEHRLHLERNHREWLREHGETTPTGYLLVSEAELAAALREHDPVAYGFIGSPSTSREDLDHDAYAAAIFAALGAAQEKGEAG